MAGGVGTMNVIGRCEKDIAENWAVSIPANISGSGSRGSSCGEFPVFSRRRTGAERAPTGIDGREINHRRTAQTHNHPFRHGYSSLKAATSLSLSSSTRRQQPAKGRLEVICSR